MRTALLFASSAFLFAAATTPVQIRSIDNAMMNPFRPADKANVLFFVSSDCPVSNSYAPEIQRLCREFGPKGASCSLFYEDVDIKAPAVRKHLGEFGYKSIPVAIDAERKVAKAAKADVTPEAVVVDAKGEIRYRGRIDNFYADLGKPRQQVTSRDLSDALNAVIAGKRVPNPETPTLGCFIVDPETLRK
jgi:thiol-disulfide isomerase/thioredoxin